MTNAVTQAGYARVPPQAASRAANKNDAADGAFRDAVQSGEKKSQKTGPSAGEEPMAAADIALESRQHPLGRPWRPEAKVDPTKTDSEPSGWETEARADRKLFEKIMRASRADVEEASAADPEKRDADKPADDMPPELAAFLDGAKRDIEPEGKPLTETAAIPDGAEAALAADGKTVRASRDRQTAVPGERRPDTHAGINTVAAADDDNGPDNDGGRNAAKAGNAATPPVAPRDSATQAERVSSRADRAFVEDARTVTREAGEAHQAEAPAAANPKVSVVNAQALPAPANGTAAAFIDAISADAVWKAAAPEAASHLSAAARPHPDGMHSLKIQLHPAELGMVTADLRFAGEQLSVELKVESAEAYHRLARDADTIVKAFRALGYEIDQVTIQQPQPAGQAARADTGGAGSGAFPRDLQSAFSGNSGGDGGRPGGQAGQAEGGNDARHSDGGGAAAQGRSSRGLYI